MASIDELTLRFVSVGRELAQYRLSFALVCDTVLCAVAQYPLGATRAVLLSELLERAVVVQEQQLLTSARALAFTAHCTFDIVAQRALHGAASAADDDDVLRLLTLRVARDDDNDDGDASSLLRFVVPSRKWAPLLLPHCRTLLMTGLHFGLHDQRLLLPTHAVVPVLDSLAFLGAAGRQRLSLLQLLDENADAGAPMVLVAPAYYLKCDVVRCVGDDELLLADGTLDSAGDGVSLRVADRASAVLSLVRVGDTVVLLDCAFMAGRLYYLDERTVLARMRERREPVVAAATASVSGSSLFGSPPPSGGGGSLLSPSAGALRSVPRNARGELDFEHLNRVTNVRDLRRGHVNVSLMVLVESVTRSRDADYPLVLRVRDSFGCADVHVSARLAPHTLVGGEIVYMQNVCALKRTFVLGERGKLTLVSLTSSILVTPSLCRPRALGWLAKRSRSQRARAPLLNVAIAAQVTQVCGARRGCTVAAHAVCERAVAFSSAHGMRCEWCERSVSGSEIVPAYTLQCTLVDGEHALACTLRNDAAYRLLGMTATLFERLDEPEREQLIASASGRDCALFVASVDGGESFRIDCLVSRRSRQCESK
jgi:hypothetical protein